MGHRHQIGRVALTEFKLSARGPTLTARAHGDYHNLCGFAPSNEPAPRPTTPSPDLFIINPNRAHNSSRDINISGGEIRLRPMKDRRPTSGMAAVISAS